jgi:hypothetical protein
MIPMTRISFAAAIAAVALMTAPLLVGPIPAEAQNLKVAQNLKMAQVDVRIGEDRDRYRYRRDRDSDVTVGIGTRGVTVGPRRDCRMVTTTIQRDDGRTITRRERRCD